MRARFTLFVFIGLCAAALLAWIFIAPRLTNSPVNSISTVTQHWSLVERQKTLPSGEDVSEKYHFNGAALRRMAVGPESILVLTAAGNVLRFERNDLRPTLERVPLSEGIFLTYVPEKGFFLGCANGEVFRIDSLDLKLTHVGKLGGQPQWMGSYVDSKRKELIVLAAVQKFGAPEKAHLTLYKLSSNPPSSTEYELPRGMPMGLASAFFVDNQNQLWLGGDQGEWGGWCARIDLNTDKMIPVKRHTSEGIYGFVGLPNGQVWAYGGMMHLGISRGSVARVDEGFRPFERVFQESSEWGPRFPESDEAKKPPKIAPKYPITHILPDPGGDGLLVFAYSDLFRTDFALKEWTRLCEIELKYTWGRPDAVGSYPAIKSVQALGGDSKDLLCATEFDGLLRISAGKVIRYVVDD